MLANWLPTNPLQSMNRLQEMVDELYEKGLLPPVDLYLNEHDVIVELAAAGAMPNDFQVAIVGNTVTITGQVRPELGLGEAEYQTIRRGPFEQSLNLPVPVDASSARATYRDGILRLRISRSQGAKPQLVPVERDTGDEEQELPEHNLQRERVSVGHEQRS